MSAGSRGKVPGWCRIRDRRDRLRPSCGCSWPAAAGLDKYGEGGGCAVLRYTRELFAEDGLVTALGERNMLMAGDETSIQFRDVDMPTRLMLGDPQTSGGLLARRYAWT